MRLFEERGVVLFDAAMGTALLAAGQQKGTGSEMMNLSSPEIVLKIHLENISAGSDVITSNTFGITQMMTRGEEGALGILEKGVGIAKRAVAEHNGDGSLCVNGLTQREPSPLCSSPLCSACLGIGPSGTLLGPFGDMSYDSIEKIYAAQAEAGLRAGADFILLETFADVEEFARAARAAAKASGLPVLGTMTFGESGRTFMGSTVKELMDVAKAENLSATGANCTLAPEEILPVITEMLSLSDGLPIIAQPNAGQPVYSEGKTLYKTSDEAFVAGAEKLIDLGVSGIGGCCGTTPSIISEIRDMIDRRCKS